jgi:hypothetical protein
MIGHPHTRHLTADDLVLVYFDEFPDRRGAEAHLAACESCRREFAGLGDTLAMIADHQDVTAPEGFERVMWARVQREVESSTRSGWRHWFSIRWLGLAAGVTTVVITAFVAGRWTSAPEPAPASAVAADGSETAPARVLLGAAGEHLDRSQRVLVELLNAEPEGPMSAAEREHAADLVAASRLIRRSASDAGETALADVLGDLERVLMELANGTDEDTAAELRHLRERIESRGILFRMRVVGSDMREREKVNGPPVS